MVYLLHFGGDTPYTIMNIGKNRNRKDRSLKLISHRMGQYDLANPVDRPTFSLFIMLITLHQNCNYIPAT